MWTLAPIALTGLLVGLRHAADADHVAAVSAIVARERTLRGAAFVGAAWGLGHTLTLFVFGGSIVAFGFTVPPRVALTLELFVGLMLLGLGVWNVLNRRSIRRAGRTPSPDGFIPKLWVRVFGSARRRSEAAEWSSAPRSAISFFGSHRLGRALRPLAIGSMHGLAGSAAAALLVMAASRGTSLGLAYLLVFGLGTMMGMTALTTVFAVPMRTALSRHRAAETWVRLGSGLLSFAIGALMIYQIGFRDGLFVG